MPRARPAWAVLLLAGLAAACGATPLPDPAQTDEALVEGRVLPLPIEGSWPRLGLQWTYEVVATGYPEETGFPPRIAYRLTGNGKTGHPWDGWWMYGQGRGMELTGATIRDERVFFHPPRLFWFSDLEYAPFPEANPGRPGTTKGELTLGSGYGTDEGRSMAVLHRDLRFEAIEVPAGRFERAWLVEGETPGFKAVGAWTSRMWWVPRVGWARIEWTGADGRRLELRLAAVREIPAPR